MTPPRTAPDAPGAAKALLDAAEAVRAARVRYAEAFLRFKMRGSIRDVTDGQAHQQAILETGDELTVLEAELFLVKQGRRPSNPGHDPECRGALVLCDCGKWCCP